jgi:hypothetical protein
MADFKKVPGKMGTLKSRAGVPVAAGRYPLDFSLSL